MHPFVSLPTRKKLPLSFYFANRECTNEENEEDEKSTMHTVRCVSRNGPTVRLNNGGKRNSRRKKQEKERAQCHHRHRHPRRTSPLKERAIRMSHNRKRLKVLNTREKRQSRNKRECERHGDLRQEKVSLVFFRFAAPAATSLCLRLRGTPVRRTLWGQRNGDLLS